MSTAVWMGHRDARRSLGAVKGVARVSGGTWPARTWQAYMKRALERSPIVPFNQPAPITQVSNEAKTAVRKGFQPGDRRSAGGTDPGRYLPEGEDPPLTVDAPSTTTSTTKPKNKNDDD